MPGRRALRNAAHGPVFGRGVVFGDPDDKAGDQQPDDRAQPQTEAVDCTPGGHRQRLGKAEQPIDHERDRTDRQNAGRDQPLVERLHDPVVGTEPDEERPDHRGHDASGADHERQQQHAVAQRRRKKDCRKQHRRDDRHDIGLEQICRHPGAIPDIITDIVGNNGWIARVILGNAGFHLADEVSSDIRALGKDAAAESGKNRDQRGTEARTPPSPRAPGADRPWRPSLA